MTTGKRPASDASRQLRNPKSTAKQREVAASDLAQAQHRRKPQTPSGGTRKGK